MPVSPHFRDFVLEQLAPAGRVAPRAMFGGIGLYLDGLFFALIDDDTLYFKADAKTCARYEEAGSRRFCPYPDGPQKAMGYWQVPAEVLEDADDLAAWAREAVGVALAQARHRRRRRAGPARERTRR